MSKNKTTAKYQNPDDAPITYSRNDVTNAPGVVEAPRGKSFVPNFSAIVNSSEKDEKTNTNVTPTKAIDVAANAGNNADERESSTTVSKSSVVQDIPESVFTNYVSVRIVGRHKLAGKHMMSPITIANIVMESNSDFCILTSEQTARLIRKIIMNYGSRLNFKDASIERKEQMLSRFENNLKKFKF
jgi:hypothetical protein